MSILLQCIYLDKLSVIHSRQNVVYLQLKLNYQFFKETYNVLGSSSFNYWCFVTLIDKFLLQNILDIFIVIQLAIPNYIYLLHLCLVVFSKSNIQYLNSPPQIYYDANVTFNLIFSNFVTLHQFTYQLH